MKGLLAMVLLAPATLLAQSALDGTWRTDPQSTEYVGHQTFSLQDGVYKCSTCVPKLDVKADGQDHKVSGSPYYDTINIRAVDDHTVETTSKKGAKVSGTSKQTASEDGKTLVTEFTFVTEGGQSGNGKFSATRVGAAPAGAHKISGEWQPGKLEGSENVFTVTYKATDDGLSMSDLTGDSYTAKFDGKDYPYKGDPGTTTVSLKKIDANTLEETDKRNGKVITVLRMTVSPDGKSLSTTVEDKLAGVTTKGTAHKQ